MKTFYYFFIITLLILISSKLNSQIISEDFESYTAGTKLCKQSLNPIWGTWSGTKGGTDDAFITSSKSHSGSNAISIVVPNDIVLNLNDLSTGRYKIEFYMLINTGKVGYFNILHKFAGTNSEWGTQVFFHETGICKIDAGGLNASVVNYTQDQWIHIEAIVDLDDDFATMYFNENEVASWKWSGGSFGNDSLCILDAVNFYGWTTDTTKIASEFFVDDISVTEVQGMASPLNLTSVLDVKNVFLSWDIPTVEPTSYLLQRNGKVVGKDIMIENYLDENLYPGNYDYTVRAHYVGLGYSGPSNISSILVPGGVKRELVLFEINTGTWCTYCPGAAMGADDLVENQQDVAIIEYHNGDTYATTDCQLRETYYKVTGFPTTSVDGLINYSGGSATESMYPSYLIWGQDRTKIPSVNNLEVSVTDLGNFNYQAKINIEETYQYFTSGLKLRAVLTESHIPEIWRGQTEVNFVCRKMLPTALGRVLDFSETNIQEVTINFSTAGYVKDNCELIVFVQHDPSKEVLQTAKFELKSIVSVDDNIDKNKIVVYPNPTTDYINIFTNGNGSIELFNGIGQIVSQRLISNSCETINLEKMSKGLYFVKIINGTNVYTEKLIIE